MTIDIENLDMRATVLGPLTILSDGVPHSPSAFKPRQVLALLLMNANRTVLVQDFIRELWDEEPPRSALTTLQTYILQLRKFLARSLQVPSELATKKILVTVPGGYMMRIKRGNLDLDVFNQLSLRGRQALSAGELDSAAELSRSALETWQGRALVDVPAGPVIAPKLRSLEEAKLVAQEQCIEVDLALGRHREVLSELAALATEHRYNETLHGQFMLALHRAGRRSEALEVYQRLRVVLIEEIGLEPSTELRKLHQRLLTDQDAGANVRSNAPVLT